MRERLAAPPSAGLEERRYPQGDPQFRSQAQRDRDRVLYSSAFQRLGGITQVSAPESGHAFHTRLTHSLKVAQVARRLAERLEAVYQSGNASGLVDTLDVDAVEAAALAHDLGHPPFGHLAEEELDKCAKSYGGFEGNAQSFRVLTRLALVSEDHPGLNLTRQTLNGTIKYPWARVLEDPKRDDKFAAYGPDLPYFEWAREGCDDEQRSLEAQIMDWADDVTYAVHDMDDFYRAGLVPLERLCNEAQEERDRFKGHLRDRSDSNEPHDLCEVADALFGQLLTVPDRYESSSEQRINLRYTGSELITRYINAVELTDDGSDAVCFEVDDWVVAQVSVLKELTRFYVIERPSLAIIQHGQRKLIRELFKSYSKAATRAELRLFPVPYAERLRAKNLDDAARVRVVVDLIASLTESAALEIYRRLSGVTAGSVLDPAGRLT